MTKRIIEITKYFHDDPAKQASSDALSWTGIWDVRPPIGSGRISLLRYLEVENAYVLDIVSILEGLGISDLTISGLKRYRRSAGAVGSVPAALSSEKKIRLENIDGLIRASLRWQIECRLYAGSRVFIVFGDDMYCYLGIQSKHPIAVKPSNNMVSHRDVSDRVADRERFFWGKGKGPR